MNRPETPSTRLIVGFYVVLAVLLLGCSHYLGPDDVQAAHDTEAALQDAIAQAQAERPDLWDTEQKERARMAVRLVAQGVTE